MGAPPDPVRAQRARMARLATSGKRLGYGFLAFAVAVFFVALVAGLPRGLVTLVIVDLAAASALLLPSIVIGYGVRAAEREDPGPAR